MSLVHVIGLRRLLSHGLVSDRQVAFTRRQQYIHLTNPTDAGIRNTVTLLLLTYLLAEQWLILLSIRLNGYIMMAYCVM